MNIWLLVLSIGLTSVVWATPLSERAAKIHRSALLVDGHNDLAWRLREEKDMQLQKHDLLLPQPKFHTDIPRLRQGGVGAQFWSAYVPADLGPSEAVKTTREQIALIHLMIGKYPQVFEQAKTAADVERIHASGRIASLIGIEGGHSIGESLDVLREFYANGARYMTLTHWKSLKWADAATDKEVAGGLSAFGEEVVREMNRLGMLVDISHVSPKTMRHALRISQAPVIASHSSAYAIKNHVRNVPDDVLKLVAQNGGVVMVNFFRGFVGGAASDVRTVADHIDHIVKVAGIDHVGLGADFDGVPDLPAGLEDVSKYPVLIEELLRRGYTETDVRKVLGLNALRALAAAETAAKKLTALSTRK